MIESFFKYRINIVLLIFFICINSFEGRVDSDSYIISPSFYKKMPLEKEISDYFFSPNAFFVWTLMHLIFTLRKDDYKSTIKVLLDFNVYKANKSEKI